MNTVEESLVWLHSDLSRIDFKAVLQDMAGRLRQQPTELRSLFVPRVLRIRGEILAACYFKPLAGGVATLAKIRSTGGWEQAAVDLMSRQAADLQNRGIAQVQAVVPEGDAATADLLARAGWNHLTHVQHQWLDCRPYETAPAHAPPTAAQLWRPANTLARSRFARLIEGTFQQTLDCPALNGLRDSSQVLEGFLEGRSWRSVDRLWEVLQYRGQLAGCLIMQAHGQELLELTYLGLLPQARGQRLGQQLIVRAQQHCQQRKVQALVAAVDEQNWPALQLYRQLGFEPQQRFEVWLYKAS